MELRAAISALESLKEKCKVDLYSDSKYLVDAINKGWLSSWINNGWKKADKKPVLNKDLWIKIEELNNIHDVRYIWVKGHDGNEYNEICDNLATSAIESDSLNDDTDI